MEITEPEELIWHHVTDDSQTVIPEGGRIHVNIEGRFVTVLRIKGKLHAIDSICYHAGGPLTLGPVQDIEDLGVTVIECPWHRFKVDIEQGCIVYEATDVISGRPTPVGWRVGKHVQRVHVAREENGKQSGKRAEVSLRLQGVCRSDADAHSVACAQPFTIHSTT